MTMTIRKLSEHPSKEEEIKFFEEVAESMPFDSYLRNFFNSKMVGWVRDQIKNDFTADLYEWYESAMSRESDEVNNSMEMLKKFDRKVAEYDKLLADARAMIQERDELVERLVKLNNELSVQSEQYVNKLIEQSNQLDENEQRIVTLKARLYDVIEGNK